MNQKKKFLSGKILIVDDEKRMCRSLKILLSRCGHRVVTTCEGRKALLWLEKENFDIVISDIRMPDIDGFEILKYAREKSPSTLVIFITGYASLDSALEAINYGAYDYLTKPVEIEKLKLSIEKGLEKKYSDLLRKKLLYELNNKNSQLRKKYLELNALYQASKSLISTLDLKKLLFQIVGLATKVIGARTGSVMLLDDVRKELFISAAIGLEQEIIRNTRLKLGKSIAGYVAKSGKSLIVEDVEKDYRFKRINRQKYETHSLLSVPLKIKNKILGVINLNNKKNKQKFNQADLKLLSTLASQAAVAINEAYLFEQTKRKITELSVLYDISSRLSLVDNPEEILARILSSLQKIMPADFCLWWGYNEKQNRLFLKQAEGLQNGTLYLELALTSKDIADQNRIQSKIENRLRSYNSFNFSSLICISLTSEKALNGVFCVGSLKNGNLLKDYEYLVSIVASQTAFLYERQKAIQNAGRLMAMGRMVSEISHDLKKPLTNIKGSLQILKEKWTEDKVRETFLDTAEKEVVHLNQLVKELVDFSHPRGYSQEKKSILPILEKALDLISTQMNSQKVSLEKYYSSHLHQVFLNENQILEVFLNLFFNALESMPQGGKMKITLKTEAHKSQKYLTVEITDTGCGIAGENLDRIFERYFTTKEGGTGLGLSIVERTMLAHNGKVLVKSQSGQGSCFKLLFPLT